MIANQTTIYVYDDFSFEQPILLGTLFVDVLRGQENYSFEYDENWLNKTKCKINLDPDLMLYSGRQYANGNKMFGVFADSSPDRWGRTLMNRKERLLADSENRKPNKLHDSDYLLGVYDECRMGGLRFKTNLKGSFVSNDSMSSIPPWTTLRTLEEASRNYEKDENINNKWVDQLIKPGSSLGGARPKASVMDTNGQLWIAKFPSKNDENDTGAWEKVVHDLAKMCDLDVPESKLEKFSNLGSTFLVKRFDRVNSKRIHFASAMTLLGKKDGANAADGTSYIDMAEFIKTYGSNPQKDLLELWKRIVFNMAVSNTDDHLRNHAFILTETGWSLSPLFDVNPIPYGTELSLNVNGNDNRINISLALDSAHYFGILEDKAKLESKKILYVIKNNWEKLAIKYGLTRNQISNMKQAFRLADEYE